MHILDNVWVWNLFRAILDRFFGMYRKSIQRMREFGVEETMSVIDVGCGTGHYSQLTKGEYLGIDSDCRYIDAAKKRYGTEKKQFVCFRLQDMDFGGRSFDVTLLIVLDPVKQRQGNLVGRFFTSIDRGKYIRAKEDEVALIREYFDIVTIKESCDILHIDGIAVLARPKS